MALLEFPAPPKSIALDDRSIQSLMGNSLELPGEGHARMRVDIRIHPTSPEDWDDVGDDEFTIELSAVLITTLLVRLDSWSDRQFQISRDRLYGTTIQIALDFNEYPIAHQSAIQAINAAWAEFESETRQAIARRKQAYSLL